MTYEPSDDVSNPYEPPAAGSKSEPIRVSSLFWSVVVAFGCCVVGGALGLVIGASLGALVPDYYRGVFARGNDPDFDPLSVGIGLGLSQGLFVGALVGIGLVAIHHWYRSRMRRS